MCTFTSVSLVTTRAGPNIPLNLPIIQIIILHFSTPLFKRKLPITLKKSRSSDSKYEWNMNMTMYILANKCRITCEFLFIVSSEAKETFSTPKNDRRLYRLSLSCWLSIWSQTHVIIWYKVFYFKHTLCMCTTSLSSWEAHYSTSSRSCLLFKKLFTNIWPRPTPAPFLIILWW